ncbi:MAG: hypothetical protein WCQ50_06895 [Spirochaetota bacterium]
MAKAAEWAKPVFHAGFEVRDCELDAQGLSTMPITCATSSTPATASCAPAASARVETAIVSGGRPVPASPEMIEGLFAAATTGLAATATTGLAATATTGLAATATTGLAATAATEPGLRPSPVPSNPRPKEIMEVTI